jgi:uncharacterized protein YjaZ
MIDNSLLEKASKGLSVSKDEVRKYNDFYNNVLAPKIKTKYLSHLITSIEDIINARKKEKAISIIKENTQSNVEEIERHLKNNTVRFYSIILSAANKKRRATTRHHKFGAIISYNPCYDSKQIRILIAHELGHIVTKELAGWDDSEGGANVFALLSMLDKNNFYTKEIKEYLFKNDFEIVDEIANVCK